MLTEAEVLSLVETDSLALTDAEVLALTETD